MEHSGIGSFVIEEICNIAKYCGVNKVILFGSRARGDYKRTSDIDLAVCGGNISRFALDVEEYTSTPLKYDVVNLDRNVQDALQKAIQTEGLTIYEKI